MGTLGVVLVSSTLLLLNSHLPWHVIFGLTFCFLLRVFDVCWLNDRVLQAHVGERMFSSGRGTELSGNTAQLFGIAL
ncbi:unnamed protein product [Toxocara canis]|uniref:Inner membrane protein n=1 Tax=Toxocara canis TaxID=6265 RepID=A0A183UBG6_TOXCA|nr:unnamed protein product [Toxocara canis]